jgi:hypothetical protein
MTKIFYKIFFCIFLMEFFSAQLVQAGVCSPKEVEAADQMADKLNSWAAVDETFKKFHQCDDGSIAEGNAETIARLLVDKWDTLPQLAKLIKQDPALKVFMLRHVNTTLDSDDLEKIKNYSSSVCPKGLNTLCQDLNKASVNAIKLLSE